MLSSVVLPAPLGPMTDRISPRRTSRLTRVTAWTPPNALETSLISSWELIPRNLLRQPPLPAPVVLHVAVASLGGGLRPPSEPPPERLRRQSRRSKRAATAETTAIGQRAVLHDSHRFRRR